MSDRRWPDVRVPADTEDKQTTDARTAIPPVEFSVVKGSSSNTLSITDRQGVAGRTPTVAYRVYFCPAAFAPTVVVSSTTPAPLNVASAQLRGAARKVANLVTTVSAPGLGTVLTTTDTTNFGVKGWYFCAAVNRSSVEAPSEHMVAAP